MEEVDLDRREGIVGFLENAWKHVAGRSVHLRKQEIFF